MASAALAIFHCDNAIFPQFSQRGVQEAAPARWPSSTRLRDSNLPKVTQLVSGRTGPQAHVCLLGPRLLAILPSSPDSIEVAREAS